MTLPKKPWSISATCPRTIVDFSGNIVAMVTDARMAESILEQLDNNEAEIETLESRISQLEDEIENLREQMREIPST